MQHANDSMAPTIITVAMNAVNIFLKTLLKQVPGIMHCRLVAITTLKSWETMQKSGWKNTYSAKITFGPSALFQL